MKFGVVFAVGLLAVAVNSYPASKDKAGDGDVEIIPPFSSRGNPFDTGVIDVDADDPHDGIFRTSFGSLMDQLNAMLNAMRNRWRGVYDDTLQDALKKGNTTSTVEVIDGHKVIKNQTVYEDPHTFIKSVVVQVVPNDSDESTSKPSGTYTPEPDTEPIKKTKDREPLEDSVENEVNNLNEVEHFNIETLDDNKIDNKYKYDMSNAIENFDSVEHIENEQPVIDLSNDILVNDILADQGVPPNPDAEYIDNIENLGDVWKPKFEKLISI